MAAKGGQTIVIKKITIAAAGGHGGSWKVALADFMTAMMAFFLVMWLLGQSDETKKAVSDYFSTPSVIEYNFQNFGAEITMEKLFLDLVNEPLKAFQSFMEPADKTPNALDFGSAKIVQSFVMDKLQDIASNVKVDSDGFEFKIPDNVLFKPGKAEVTKNFVGVFDKILAVTTGLSDAEIYVGSGIVLESVESPSKTTAQKVAAQRLLMIKSKLQAGLENSTVDLKGNLEVIKKPGETNPENLVGYVSISVKQKPVRSDGKAARKLDVIFGNSSSEMSVYDNFVNQVSNSKKKKFGKDETLKNPVDEELSKDQPVPEETTN